MSPLMGRQTGSKFKGDYPFFPQTVFFQFILLGFLFLLKKKENLKQVIEETVELTLSKWFRLGVL